MAPDSASSRSARQRRRRAGSEAEATEVVHARYNRQRLYEEVWAEPTQLVAKR